MFSENVDGAYFGFLEIEIRLNLGHLHVDIADLSDVGTKTKKR